MPDIDDLGKELDPDAGAGISAVDEDLDRRSNPPTNQAEFEARESLYGRNEDSLY